MWFNQLEAQASQIIKRYEKHFATLTNLELFDSSVKLKGIFSQAGQVGPGLKAQKAQEFLAEAFALVREAAFRELGYRQHKEQLMAGIALYKGTLVQMQTGEGKTLAITAPAYFAALTGQAVHVITANDYLAQRDCMNMGSIYARLGISCAVITTEQQFLFKLLDTPEKKLARLQPCTRQEAYQAEITYGTAKAFGFDYLRDHLVCRKENLVGVEERLAFAILDEADNILLDEARTPLIISGQAKSDVTYYYKAVELVNRLVASQDYEVNKAKRTASFTEAGVSKLEKWLSSNETNGKESSLYSGTRSELFYLDNCLKALTLYNKDEDYLVGFDSQHQPINETFSSNATYPNNNSQRKRPGETAVRQTGEIVLVDPITGRPMPGRRLGGGLHEALEAKEGLIIKSPNSTVATISIQAYFKQYKKLAGLSGTLETVKDVLYKLYGLETLIIPTHRPVQRIEAKPAVFHTGRIALHKLVETTVKVRESGAPVLIGTPSVSLSEELSDYLKRLGVPHQVLNARQTEQEAQVIARAGYPGRITVATNMAGRGTDILLGGSYNDHLSDLAKERGLVREADQGTRAWHKLEEDARARHIRAKAIVYGAGGLHVLGLGLQSSSRLDLQLVGRAGRQGDPGYSQFSYSLQDELVVNYAASSGAYNRLVSLPSEESKTQTEELNSALAIKLVEECQRKAEGQQLDVLLQGLEFDGVLNQQRDLFYRDRQNFLLASDQDFKAKILELVSTNQETPHQNQLEQVGEMYRKAETHLGGAELATRLRKAVLERLDRAWTQYLTSLEELRQGIGLRAYGGHKPLHSYQLEARTLWDEFQSQIKFEIIQAIQKELQIIGYKFVTKLGGWNSSSAKTS